jgi:hypothetical protein
MSARTTRRRFVAGAAAAVGAAALGRPVLGARAADPGFDHVVVVMMENRSFDHMLGWLPGADGRQAGLAYADASGVQHATHPLAPDFQGCGHPDPDHSYEGGRVEYNGGACDGWLRAGANDDYAIGYCRKGDLAFLGQAAPQWTTFSRYFAAILAETYPNRIYQHAGQTDRIHNAPDISTLPTIWDRLASAGLLGRYYFSDVPFLALWGAKYIPISRPIAAFYADCALGTLPSVTFVDPRFEDEDSGTSGDDHPHADIRNGEAFMDRIYRAVTGSPNWSRTVGRRRGVGSAPRPRRAHRLADLSGVRAAPQRQSKCSRWMRLAGTPATRSWVWKLRSIPRGPHMKTDSPLRSPSATARTCSGVNRSSTAVSTRCACSEGWRSAMARISSANGAGPSPV